MRQFQSLNRAYKRSDDPRNRDTDRKEKGFNPSIGLTSVPTFKASRQATKLKQFQSLNRAYKRSDSHHLDEAKAMATVSIPQSGLQAFRHL